MKKNLPYVEGNIRDLYDIGNGELVIVTSNKMSILGTLLPTEFTYIGNLSNNLAAFWFKKIETTLHIPTHFISVDTNTMPEQFRSKEFENRCMKVKKLNMLPVKCVVRGYLAGNSPAWKTYETTGQISGYKLPKGLRKNEKLPCAIFCPTYIDESGTEKEVTFTKLCDLIGEDIAKIVRDYSIRIFIEMAEYAKKHFLIFADSTFRFGLDSNGNVVLAAECLTPATTRIWDLYEYRIWSVNPEAKMPTQYDKEFVIDYLISSGWTPGKEVPEIPKNIVERTLHKYIEVYDWLTETSSHYVTDICI